MTVDELAGAVTNPLLPTIPADAKLPSEIDADIEDGGDGGLAPEITVGVVLADYDAAVAYQNDRKFPARWDQTDRLYSAFVDAGVWPDGVTPRASVGIPVLLTKVQDIGNQLNQVFFGSPQLFAVKPRAGTKPETAAAEQALLRWELDNPNCDFVGEFTRFLKLSFLLYGFGCLKLFWKTVKRERRVYSRKAPQVTVQAGLQAQTLDTKNSDEIDYTVVSEEINLPVVEYVPLRQLKWDPACRTDDINAGRFILHQMYLSASDLDLLRGQPGYTIPSADELKKLVIPGKEAAITPENRTDNYWANRGQAKPINEDSGGDPLQQPFEVIEEYKDGQVITVLQRSLIIRNEPNENAVYFFSASMLEAPDSAHGYGVDRLVGGEQMIQAGTLNLFLDAYSIAICGVYEDESQPDVGTQTPTQAAVAPGSVLKPGLRAVQRTTMTSDALAVIQDSESRADRNSGANVPTQAYRTGTGISDISQKIDGQMQEVVDMLSRKILVALLESIHKLNLENLKPSQIQQILGDQAAAYNGDVLDIYNGQYTFSILAGAKLRKRTAALQALPALTNLLSAPAVQSSLIAQHKKVNYVRFIGEMLDSTGIDSSEFIEEMTQEEISDEAAQEQAQQQLAQQQQGEKFQQELQLVNAKTEAAAGRDVIKARLKGEPGAPAI